MKFMVMKDTHGVLKIDEIKEMLTEERDKRNKLSTNITEELTLLA